ncbi:cytochrome P450 [Westerdykella ornata]|uniref:Cytochrome P450 n=1 Tax=Westerdykella ornata TaxID=318751 RepID=A0A6A6JK29_WESOR|nr:cytochrome P450 [Westerdykella ornata]KAF2276822.1 cytochrome P450 [Westerdykella ornata]
MGPGKTVVVRDPALAAHVQRQSPDRSFYGAILEVTKRLVGFDDRAMEVVMAAALSPGKHLDLLIAQQASTLATQLREAHISDTPISLMAFIQQHFTFASALTLYGPHNPFARNPSLLRDFWTYEAGMMKILLSPWPWMTARRAWKARERVNAGFTEYVERRGYEQGASAMIRQRVGMNLRYGLGEDVAARSELIMLFAVLGNAVPGTFWTVVNLYGRPELLRRVREEVEMNAVVEEEEEDGGEGEGGKKRRLIDVARLKSHCPLLVSATRESLRRISNMSSVRLVTRSHTISAPGSNQPSYLLQKGTVVQIASGVMHHDEQIWGKDAEDFVAERFINAPSATLGQPKKGESEDKTTATASITSLPPSVAPSAYRVFGGGSSLCPGRHFAMSEIVAFVALCVCMFDMEGEEGGVVEVPERDDRRVPLSVMKPVRDVRVRMRRRGGGREEWGVVVEFVSGG